MTSSRHIAAQELIDIRLAAILALHGRCGWTYEDIGRLFGFRTERARQLHLKAVAELARAESGRKG